VNPQDAAQRWQTSQAQTLVTTYRTGVETGRHNFRTQHATPPAPPPGQMPTVQPPAAATLMTAALSPALASLAAMAAAMGMLVPSAAQIAAAGSVLGATAAMFGHYLASNAFRLAGGVSVAWTGEQHGYSLAATEQGLLLRWQLDMNANHCADCPALAALPPMPLGMWPTLPGDGGTQCAAGCKCSMDAVAALVPTLTSRELGVLNTARARMQDQRVILPPGYGETNA
jgi:hypothetical protein